MQNKSRHACTHSSNVAASQQTFTLTYTHTHTLPWRAPGRGESSSSSEVERKPIGQIRFRRFLTELSINLQHCAVIRRDLGLSHHSVWECSERLLIRPGGHGAYDDITQPLSLYTHPSVSLCVCLPICPVLFPLFPLSCRVRRWLHSSNGCLLNLTSECNLCSLIRFCGRQFAPQFWPNTTKHAPSVSNVTHFHPFSSTGTSTGQTTTDSQYSNIHFPSHTYIHDRPLNNTHTHPHCRATAIPLWMMRLCWDGDKWAFITAMMAPSSTRERNERKRCSLPFIPFVHHLPCPRVLNA